MKKKSALIASFLITLAVAIPMLLIGLNAYFNPTTSAQSSAATASVATAPTTAISGTPQAQIAQLQAALAQSNQQVQAYQQVMTKLEQVGLIQTTSTGSIILVGAGVTLSGN